jgi:hypothetical protein
MTDDLDYLLLAFGRYQAQLDVADFDKKEGLCRIATMKQDLALLVGLNRDVGGKRNELPRTVPCPSPCGGSLALWGSIGSSGTV